MMIKIPRSTLILIVIVSAAAAAALISIAILYSSLPVMIQEEEEGKAVTSQIPISPTPKPPSSRSMSTGVEMAVQEAIKEQKLIEAEYERHYGSGKNLDPILTYWERIAQTQANATIPP